MSDLPISWLRWFFWLDVVLLVCFAVNSGIALSHGRVILSGFCVLMAGFSFLNLRTKMRLLRGHVDA